MSKYLSLLFCQYKSIYGTCQKKVQINNILILFIVVILLK